MRLGVNVGQVCEAVLDEKMRNLDCNRVEVDEIWGFIGKKQANAFSTDNRDDAGEGGRHREKRVDSRGSRRCSEVNRI